MNKQEDEINKQTEFDSENTTNPESVIDADIEKDLAARQNAIKKKNNKKRNRYIGIGITVFLFYQIYAFLFAPYYLSTDYGICKTLLEFHVTYPQSIRVSEAVFPKGSVRIWYSQTDAFGQNRLDSFQCFFKNNKDTGITYLSKIRIGKAIDLSNEEIERYNKILPLMASLPIDTKYPSPLPDSIGALQLDIEKFRRIKIDDIMKR